MQDWKELKFWETGEYQVIQERLKDLDKEHKVWCPGRSKLYKALEETPFDKVKVAILGQDPYPDPKLATGIAFSIPKDIPLGKYPPTLFNIFKEYTQDLGYPFPKSGCLEKWCSQGILLWNVVPTCTAGAPLSHDSWSEWKLLTQEMVEELSTASVLFVFLGGRAREFLQYVDLTNSEVIVTSHPSPRGIINSKNSFKGSRLFSTINDKLCGEGREPIDWRL